MEKTLVLASGNEGKAREFRAILEPLGFKIVLQKTLGIDSPEENGKSFLENAIIKAISLDLVAIASTSSFGIITKSVFR